MIHTQEPLLQHALLSTEGRDQHRQLAAVFGRDSLYPPLMLGLLLARVLIPEADNVWHLDDLRSPRAAIRVVSAVSAG